MMDSTLPYMMAGYLIIWALAFAFVFNLWARSRRLERDLETVRQLVEELDQEES
jgi:CcmD family protein